jgi:hypothetical protein
MKYVLCTNVSQQSVVFCGYLSVDLMVSRSVGLPSLGLVVCPEDGLMFDFELERV